MMPGDAIDALERQIEENGEDVRLQRMAAGAVSVTVDCRAFVRPAGVTVDGGVVQQGFNVSLSAPQLLAAGWPEPAVLASSDRIRIQGRMRTIVEPGTLAVGGVPVRVNLKAIG